MEQPPDAMDQPGPEPESAIPVVPKCAHCGAPVDPTGRFCPSCGRAVGVTRPDVDIESWVRAGWQVFIRNVGAAIALALVLIGPLLALLILFYASYFGSVVALVGVHGRHVTGLPLAVLAIVGVFAGLCGLFFAFVWWPLQAGVYACMLAGIRTGRLSAEHLGDGFRNWWACTWVFWMLNIVTVMCVPFVFLLVGIPAIIALSTLMWLSALHIVDKRQGGAEAVNFAWKLLRGRLWMMLLFTFLIGILSGAGAMAMYLGVVVTFPISAAAFAAAYDDLSKRETSRSV